MGALILCAIQYITCAHSHSLALVPKFCQKATPTVHEELQRLFDFGGGKWSMCGIGGEWKTGDDRLNVGEKDVFARTRLLYG